MQVNNNSYRNNTQNFGMALKMSPEVKKEFAKCLIGKTEIDAFNSLYNVQLDNPFIVDMRKEAGKITAYIYDTTKNVMDNQLTVLKENLWERYFSNLGFLRRCCKVADKKNEDTYMPYLDSALRETLRKISE